MAKERRTSVRPRTVAWLARPENSREVESVLATVCGHSDRGSCCVLKPNEGVPVRRRAGLEEQSGKEVRSENKYVHSVESHRADDQSIQYWDFSPPPFWQVPYSILRVKFLPVNPGGTNNFMSHLGEEILIPLSSSVGDVQYSFLKQEKNGEIIVDPLPIPLRHGEIVRIDSKVPHRTWAEEGESHAWMIFEDASETSPAIRTDATKNTSLRARTFSLEFFREHPECYAMVALGISETIRLYRNRADFQIGDLAGLSDVGRAHLSKAEEGRANLSIEALMRIAGVLAFNAPKMLSNELWPPYKRAYLDDIDGEKSGRPLCSIDGEKTGRWLRSDDTHFLHPITCRIAKGKKIGVPALPTAPFGTFSSWVILSGEVIFETRNSQERQQPRKELLQEGSVLHLRGTTKCDIEARVDSQLLEVLRSPLCPKSRHKRKFKDRS